MAMLLALLCLPVAAQETVDASSLPADERAREQMPEDPNAPPEVPVEEEVVEAEVIAPPAGPLEDYEASEQISEDLSVSFPVDI
ncbi:MAG: hypothetical protein AAGA95_04440 [Pseudomonadota bacterium]